MQNLIPEFTQSSFMLTMYFVGKIENLDELQLPC